MMPFLKPSASCPKGHWRSTSADAFPTRAGREAFYGPFKASAAEVDKSAPSYPMALSCSLDVRDQMLRFGRAHRIGDTRAPRNGAPNGALNGCIRGQFHKPLFRHCTRTLSARLAVVGLVSAHCGAQSGRARDSLEPPERIQTGPAMRNDDLRARCTPPIAGPAPRISARLSGAERKHPIFPFRF